MRIAFLSDIHANLPALEATLEAIDALKPDSVYCLGDLVGYNYWAEEVCQIIRNRAIPTIMGNHDEYQSQLIEEGDKSNKGLTRDLLSTSSVDFLSSLPKTIDLTFEVHQKPFRIKMVHGSVYRINEYIRKDYPVDELFGMLPETDLLFCAHTHLPYYREIEKEGIKKYVINTGSVGRPKDGDPRACFCMLEINKNGIVPAFHRVEFDLDKAVSGVSLGGFEPSLIQKMREGR